MKHGFDFDDILIEPKSTTISSRSDVSPFFQFDDNVIKMYWPIISAPMDTVVDTNNREEFESIFHCFPRKDFMSLKDRVREILDFPTHRTSHTFWAFGLDDTFKLFSYLIQHGIQLNTNICIDVANGHMDKVKRAIQFRNEHEILSNIGLMVGNVATAEEYRNLSNLGAEWVRVGIGFGGACLTTTQTGVGAPMASLIQDCYTASLEIETPAKIVADGGFSKYSDIIKALALGADLVMLGSILNKSLEANGNTYWKGIKVPKLVSKFLWNRGCKLYRKFRGMSTKEVQRKWGKTLTKTSEGVTKIRPVEYTFSSWLENFDSYLRSAMSYTNSYTLQHFKSVNVIRMTQNSFKRFSK